MNAEVRGPITVLMPSPYATAASRKSVALHAPVFSSRWKNTATGKTIAAELNPHGPVLLPQALVCSNIGRRLISLSC